MLLLFRGHSNVNNNNMHVGACCPPVSDEYSLVAMCFSWFGLVSVLSLLLVLGCLHLYYRGHLTPIGTIGNMLPFPFTFACNYQSKWLFLSFVCFRSVLSLFLLGASMLKYLGMSYARGILLFEIAAAISVSEVPHYFLSVIGILVFQLPMLSFPVLYMYL